MQFHGSNGAEIIDVAAWCRRFRFAGRAAAFRRNPDDIEAITARALGWTWDNARAATEPPDAPDE